MEPVGSFLHLEGSATGPHHITLLSILILSYYLDLCLPGDLFPSDFQNFVFISTLCHYVSSLGSRVMEVALCCSMVKQDT
jgi:hypothetical protein